MPNLPRPASTSFVLAGLIALAITAYGQGLWGLLVLANLKWHREVPWAPVLMLGLLAALIAWLGGRGWPRRTSEARRRLLRWNPMPASIFGWAVLAGILALLALGGAWITLSDLVHIPPGLTPSLKGVPLWTAAAFLVVSSLAAPLTEEAAFRGYAQTLLERAWGWAPAAILGSSVLFAAAHVTQGLDAAKLGLYFAAGLIFGTVAYLTNSLYAAMVIHSLGDFMGFTLLWPHDRAHRLVTEGGHDPLFWPAVAILAVFTPLALLAFHHLARLTGNLRSPAPTLVAAAR